MKNKAVQNITVQKNLVLLEMRVFSWRKADLKLYYFKALRAIKITTKPQV